MRSSNCININLIKMINFFNFILNNILYITNSFYFFIQLFVIFSKNLLKFWKISILLKEVFKLFSLSAIKLGINLKSIVFQL